MTGHELIKEIEDLGLQDLEIFVNLSYENNSSYVFGIKDISMEASNLVAYINIGKIDEQIQMYKDSDCPKFCKCKEPIAQEPHLGDGGRNWCTKCYGCF